MKVESTLFTVYFAFLFAVSIVYFWLSGDPAGTVMLALSGGLAFIIAYFLWFTSRRMEVRPEDRPDAEISEGSGEMGFFPPHSWWPIFTALAFTTTTLGLVFGPFLFVIGAGAILITSSGFLFEYYLGVNRSQGQTLQALEGMGEAPTSTHKWLGD